MCNLYAMTRSQEEIRRLFHVGRDRTGNLPALSSIYPDTLAPVVRTGPDGARDLVWMRWGFPPPPHAGPALVNNIRNPASPYWRPWLERGFRCLVPATSFCEWTDARPKAAHWFGLAEDRPLFAFAAVWRPWVGVRGPKSAATGGEHELFSILTTEPNDIVRPVHAKAMPVILATPAEQDQWLERPVGEALALQRPLANGRLNIVATGLERKTNAADRKTESVATLF